MFWELDRVSRSEREIVEILNDDTIFAQPVGIIVFGADSGLKAKAYKRLRGKISEQPLGIDHSGISNHVGQVIATFRRGGSVIVCFPGEASVHPGLVFQLERSLNQLGAKSIVAVYAAAVKGDSPDFAYLDRSGLSYAEYLRQLKKLAADPPTYGGVDGFITVRQRRPGIS